MQGRKNKPTELKLLAGNPGKRPLPKTLKYESGDIEIPKELQHEKYDKAREEWERQAPVLKSIGVFRKPDRTALVAYCIAYQNYVNACDGIRDYGYFIRTPNGQLVMNPHVKTQKIFFEQMAKMASEFGLTPSSRVPIGGLDDEEKSVDDLAKKIFG